uniref:Uncharacterized protein n=1 Tax=Rhizophora mucronata TaxID=61149 RepID=A0A2P2PFW2_RHIMU
MFHVSCLNILLIAN